MADYCCDFPVLPKGVSLIHSPGRILWPYSYPHPFSIETVHHYFLDFWHPGGHSQDQGIGLLRPHFSDSDTCSFCFMCCGGIGPHQRNLTCALWGYIRSSSLSQRPSRKHPARWLKWEKHYGDTRGPVHANSCTAGGVTSACLSPS